MGGTLAAALAPEMQPGQVVIIMCPPHLVPKWEREIYEVGVPRTYVKVLERVEDVSAFMAEAQRRQGAFCVGIISREMAKAGEGWTAAVNWRQEHIARWPRHAQPSEEQQQRGLKRIATIRTPMCPTCGAPVYKDSHVKLPEPATEGWLTQLPRYCEACGGALWTNRRTFSVPKPGKPLRNPKVPLSKFIAERYPDRVGLFICDEVHECKSISTDQGEALSVLANAAIKTVGLTGTLYGGNASSLYGIEFLCNPRVRERYPWGRGMSQWVRDMGVLEKVVQYRPQHDKAGKYTGKRRMEQKPKEAPGCSPLLVQEIIDHCVFVGLLDMGRAMPEYREIPVKIQPDPDVAALYVEAKKELGEYLADCRKEGDASPMAMYLQALLNWPDAPYRDEECIHRKRLEHDSDEFMERLVYVIPGLDENRIYAKEQWLIDTVRTELAQGRGVAVFCHQTGTRDIQPRLERLLKEHIPSARPFILKGSVAADKREHVLNRQVTVGTNVLICNARLVQTGLDLIDFPSIVFFEIDYSLFVMAQASRRAWRLIQDRPCKTFYPYYDGMMEHQAIQLIGRKQQAANLLYGEGNGGLSALSGSDGGNLLAALAAEIESDATVTDLRDLFAQHAHTVDPAESAWFSPVEETTVDPTESVIPLPSETEAMLLAPSVELPIVPLPATSPAAEATPVLWLTKPAAPKRRQKTRNLMAVPAIQFDLFGSAPTIVPPTPASPPPPIRPGKQLALFDLPPMYA
ncbi:MAG: helicase-related protein [Aggregatilineales bacterium]